MKQKQIAIIGATGFTGSELVRILHSHPEVNIALITSESHAGKSFSDVHPFFKDICDTQLESVSAIENYDIDLAFLALPHGVSMDFVQQFQKYNFPIVDLSGDFRLSSPEVYESWYNKKHSFTAGFSDVAYGMPELYADQIKSSTLIANPGCYPTSVILPIAPLLKAGIVDPNRIIADSKSGITGAGIKSKPVNHFSSVNDNFKAYGIKTHRHSIEIQEKLQGFSNDSISVQFTPHLLPVDRGILSTIYLKPMHDDFEAIKIKEAYKLYESCQFIRFLDQSPTIKNVRGTNYCDIFATYDERTNNIIVIAAIDNLMKGAAGQAVQNMNLLFDWEEDLGLHQTPLYP